VITRTASLNVTPFLGEAFNAPSCFFSMGLFPVHPSIYHVEDFLETERVSGTVAAVLAEVSRRHADNAAGQLAMWAASQMVNETVARELGADDSTLAQARSILELAGVLTCLNGLDDLQCRSSGPGSGPPPSPCEPIVITRPRERPAGQGGAGVNSSISFLPLSPTDPAGGLAAVIAGAIGGAVAGLVGMAAALGERPARGQSGARKRRAQGVPRAPEPAGAHDRPSQGFPTGRRVFETRSGVSWSRRSRNDPALRHWPALLTELAQTPPFPARPCAVCPEGPGLP
jgi:hypothetical protein